MPETALMFCGRCGTPTPVNASVCPRCGNAVVVVQPSTPPATMPALDSVPDFYGSTKQEAAPESVRVPLDTYGVSSGRTVGYAIIPILTIVLFLIVGMVLSTRSSHNIKVADAIRKVFADNADLQVKVTECRRQLYEIRRRRTPTMRDYYNQCMEVEKLLNDYEPIRQRASSLILKLRQMAPPDDQSSTAMWNDMDEVFRVDDQMIRDLRQEIAYSKVLITLPNGQQSKFYTETIRPVRTHENTLIGQEAKKLEELRSMGAQLPPDLLRK